MPRKNKQALSISRGRIIVLVGFLLLLYAVLPQIGGFSDSFTLLGQADWALVGLGAGLVVATYIMAACIYQLLALRRLRFWRTLAVQGAGAFANKLLPAGIGGMALNARYLRTNNHTTAQAVVVAGTNNMLGFVGHMVLLVLALLVGGLTQMGSIALPHVSPVWFGAIALLLVAASAIMAVAKVRRSVLGALLAALQVLVSYRRRWRRLLLALVCSVGLTLLYISIFYVACHAVGVMLSPLQALVIFTVGMIVGTATPTPGGIGGAEAGLVAGMVAYGHSASVALAAALLYRLLTYWLPLLPGFVLLAGIRKTL